MAVTEITVKDAAGDPQVIALPTVRQVSSAPGTLTYGQILMTGSPVQLPSRALINGLVIRARETNSGNGFVGGSSVTTTDDGTGNGFRLSPGDAWSGTPSNANQVYVIGAAGDVFYFTGS
ncbi:hypothetical protein SAMN02745157_0710 [Kaistia soli DSM 19436]|uniref:Uncharacterized protein n=1 Tax=Kaistia soli DSM 19436 TaxID=1122133 RepID=A0A1M4VHR7_9HYPH|nr:hypothetical protein [Kaistia soli]SHE68584.1 hypothetical protein SAMN02745157_0710 [Kaistia soli DSM 19436]